MIFIIEAFVSLSSGTGRKKIYFFKSGLLIILVEYGLIYFGYVFPEKYCI